MRVFADANILFSASKRDSLIQRLLAAVRLKGEMVTSEYVLDRNKCACQFAGSGDPAYTGRL